MKHSNYVPLTELCSHYHVEMSFFDTLEEVGLLRIESIEERYFIPAERVADVERMLRIYNDLNLSPEAIDVVFNLLNKLEEMQNELHRVKTRLRLYE